jgi:hypothetical protein
MSQGGQNCCNCDGERWFGRPPLTENHIGRSARAFGDISVGEGRADSFGGIRKQGSNALLTFTGFVDK